MGRPTKTRFSPPRPKKDPKKDGDSKAGEPKSDTEAVDPNVETTESAEDPVYTSPHTGKRTNSLMTVGYAWVKTYRLPPAKFLPSLFFAPCPQGCEFIEGNKTAISKNYRCSCNNDNMVRLTRIDEVGKVNGMYLVDIAMKRAHKYQVHKTVDGKSVPMTLCRENLFKTAIMDGQD